MHTKYDVHEILCILGCFAAHAQVYQLITKVQCSQSSAALHQRCQRTCRRSQLTASKLWLLGVNDLQIAGSRATSVKIGSHNDYSILQCARTKRQPATPLRKKTYQQVEVGTKVQMNLAIARGIVTP